MRNLAVILLVMFLAGCISTVPYTPPVECEDGVSVILEKFPDPRTLDKGLLLAQVAAIKTVDSYNKEVALIVLDELEFFVSSIDNLTYYELMLEILAIVDRANEDAQAILFIVGADIGQFDSQENISACDKVLIAQEFARQRVLVSMMK